MFQIIIKDKITRIIRDYKSIMKEALDSGINMNNIESIFIDCLLNE